MPGKSKGDATPGRLGCVTGLVLVAAAVASLIGSFVRPALGLPALVVSIGSIVLLMRRWRRREVAAKAHENARLARIAAPAGAAWRALCAAEGLGAHVPALAPRVRAAVRLEATPASEIAPGASRLGGSPDLPASFAWPSWNDQPLAFLAQIELAAAGGAPLPRAGHLCFFHAVDQDAWGFQPENRGASVVAYFPPGTSLARRAPPEELESVFPSCALRFVPYEDMPDMDEAPPFDAMTGDEECDRYFGIRDFLSRSGEERGAHKLLGHAEPIQGPMELECQLVTNGIDCGTPAGYRDARATELAAGSDDWRLLLQLDTDEAAEMMWGDAGRIYFWIRAQDLAAQHFDQVWAILQCH
jgi:uncharacterized protein YwqG